MALNDTNTDWANGSYEADRNHRIKISENAPLAEGNLDSLNVHDDGKSVAVGYGYDIIQNRGSLIQDLSPYVRSVDTSLYPNPEDALRQLVTEINNYNAISQRPNESDQQFSERKNTARTTLVTNANGLIDLQSEENATLLLNQTVASFETKLSEKLGAEHDLPESTERAAAISQMYRLGYHGMPSFISAVQNDDRATAWYEIRYNSNADRLRGNAIRVTAESDMFGLYRGDLDNDKTNQIMNMYNSDQERTSPRIDHYCTCS